MKIRSRLFALAFVGMLFIHEGHAQVINGSFDDTNGVGAPDPLINGYSSTPGSPTPPGWTYQPHPLSTHGTGNSTPDWFDPSSSVVLTDYFTASPDGGPFINLQWGWTGSGSWVESFGQQLGGLSLGQEYHVSFYGAPSIGDVGTLVAGVASIGTFYGDDSVETFQTPTGVNSDFLAAADWVLYSFSFTASATSLWLTFRSDDLGVGAPGSSIDAGYVFDGISVTPAPEPGVAILIGVAGLFYTLRRRRFAKLRS